MTLILHVKTESWLKAFKPDNDTRSYYRIGAISNLEHTDCVVLVSGPDQARKLLCTEHNFVYEIGGQCDLCNTPGADMAKRVGVTTF